MSAVVADTHSLLWYLNDSGKLTADALSAFETAERGGFPIYVPAIILIEIRYLVEKGRDIFETDFQQIVSRLNSPQSALSFAHLDLATARNLEHGPAAAGERYTGSSGRIPIAADEAVQAAERGGGGWMIFSRSCLSRDWRRAISSLLRELWWARTHRRRRRACRD